MLDHSTAQTICLECPNCGWGFATTLSQPLNEDMNRLRNLSQSRLNPETMEHIKQISALCHGVTCRQRIALLPKEPVLIYKAEQEAASSLSRAGKVLQIAGYLEEKFAKVYHHPGISLRNKIRFHY